MTDNDPRDGCYGSTITHRLPTVDDVGHDCEVICTVARQRIYDDDLLFVHFNEVLPGEPWMPKRKYDNRLLNNAATNPPNPTPAQIIAIRNKLLDHFKDWTPEYLADSAISGNFIGEDFLRIDWQKALQCISEDELP